jgi:hypothetical protein
MSNQMKQPSKQPNSPANPLPLTMKEVEELMNELSSHVLPAMPDITDERLLNITYMAMQLRTALGDSSTAYALAAYALVQHVLAQRALASGEEARAV